MSRGLEKLPQAAATLYCGDVMHARLKPIGHRFVYRVLNLLIDLDRLPEANRRSRLFAVNRASLYSFHERDHGQRDGTSLAAYIRGLARAEGVDLNGGKILLLCYPRLLGYVFNPLSIYYGYHRDGRLALVVYEVRNTFGEQHSYICAVRPGELSASGLRQACAKRFYVSPFIDMDMRYHFRLSQPGDDLKVRILETDRDGALLAATFYGRIRPLTTPHLLAAFLALPLVTLKVLGAIHYEAAWLWLKGLRLRPRPNPHPQASGEAAPAAVKVPDMPG